MDELFTGPGHGVPHASTTPSFFQSNSQPVACCPLPFLPSLCPFPSTGDWVGECLGLSRSIPIEQGGIASRRLFLSRSSTVPPCPRASTCFPRPVACRFRPVGSSRPSFSFSNALHLRVWVWEDQPQPRTRISPKGSAPPDPRSILESRGCCHPIGLGGEHWGGPTPQNRGGEHSRCKTAPPSPQDREENPLRYAPFVPRFS